MYRVYYTDEENQPQAHDVIELTIAIKVCAEMRKAGMRMVTMVHDGSGIIGEQGADGIIGGKLPDGSTYLWYKRRPNPHK